MLTDNHHTFMFKNYTLLLVLFFASIIQGCKKDAAPDSFSPCINEKIEKWKETGFAIYKVAAPQEPLYLFESGCIDCGDYYYNESCELICVINLEGFIENVTGCYDDIYTADKELIWKK